MALSVVNFRMHHGNAVEQVTFSGNGIKLLDLKKEILDKKEINRSLDFDLKIVDENGKVYAEDDEVVPKNATIVVRRVPSKNSLITRLNTRGMYQHGGGGGAVKALGEIVMPMKMEVEDPPPAPTPAPVASAAPPALSVPPVFAPPASAPVPAFAAPSFNAPPAMMPVPGQSAPTPPAYPAAATEAEDEDVFKMLTEEETTLKRTIPVTASWNAMGGPNGGMNGAPGHYGPHSQDPRYNKGGRGAGPNNFNNNFKPNTGICNRCHKTGHYAKYCPTIGDASFDPEVRLMNVPRTGRKTVSSLEGIDTSMSTVIQRNDGSYEVFESSARGMEKLTREGHVAGNIDMAAVPAHLKCVLSNTLLKEAVTLPCCNRNVNDSVVRLRLVSSGLVCPLCGAQGISPDSLVIRKDLRNEVENYLEGLRRAEEPAPAPAPVFSTGFAPPPMGMGMPGMPGMPGMMGSPPFPAGFVPPIPSGPPPPQPLLPPPAASLALAGLKLDENLTGKVVAGVVSTPAGNVVVPLVPGATVASPVGVAPGAPGVPVPGQPAVPGMNMAGMLMPPAMDEIPPLEALPLPLSREQFLSEQRLQITLLKELHGGVLPQGPGFQGGFQGGYQGGYQGRGGFNAGRGAGRGYQGRGFIPNYVPGMGRGRGGYQSSYQDRPYDRNNGDNRDNRDDRYARQGQGQGQGEDSRRDYGDRDDRGSGQSGEGANKRRRDEDNNNTEERSARPRSAERDARPAPPAPEGRSDRHDRSDRSDRPSDRGNDRDNRDKRDRDRERSSHGDRAKSKRGDSRARGSSRDRPHGEKRPARDEHQSEAPVSHSSSGRHLDGSAPQEEVRQDSKRRRHEEEAPRERSSARGRSNERDQARDSRGESRKSRTEDDKSRSSRSDHRSDRRSRGRSQEKQSSSAVKTDAPPKQDGGRDSRDRQNHSQSHSQSQNKSQRDRPREEKSSRGEKDRAPREEKKDPRDTAKPDKSDKPRDRDSRDSRDRGDRSGRDKDTKPKEDRPREDRSNSNRDSRARDERPRDDRSRDDRSKGGSRSDRPDREQQQQQQVEPKLILQEKDRQKGTGVPSSKIVTIPPLKSSRGAASGSGGGSAQNHQSNSGFKSGGGGGGSSKRTVIADSKRR